MKTKPRIHSFDHLHIDAEIVQLHQFFQDWYNGAIPETKAGFTRLENALAEGFRIITPDAQIIEREAILQSIESAHNTRLAMRIWIEDVRIQRWFENHILASYQGMAGNRRKNFMPPQQRALPIQPGQSQRAGMALCS